MGWWYKNHFQTFRYSSENNRVDKWWNVHTFQRHLAYIKAPPIKNSWVFTMALGCGRRTIFTLLGILPKITDGTNGGRCILFGGVWLNLKQMKKRKKSGVFTKAWGGCRRNIFRLLGILLKITDETNGERCILFREVWLTLNLPKKWKKWCFH